VRFLWGLTFFRVCARIRATKSERSSFQKEEIVPQTLCPMIKRDESGEEEQCGRPFDTGYGVRRKVGGVWQQICDACAQPSVEHKVGNTIEYIEGLKRSHPDLDWQPFLDKAYRSRRRYHVWQSRVADAPNRVRGFLRLCDEDSRDIERDAKLFLSEARLEEAKILLDVNPRVVVPIDSNDPRAINRLKARQKSLDRVRARLELGARTIEQNLKNLRTRGLITGPGWWNLLDDTVAAAVQIPFRVRTYLEGKEKVDRYQMEKLARQAAASISEESGMLEEHRLEAPELGEVEEEPVEALSGKTAEAEVPTVEKSEPEAEQIPAGGEARKAEQVTPPAATSRRARRTAEGSGRQGRGPIKFHGADADPAEAAAALNDRIRRRGGAAARRRREEAAAEKAEEIAE